MRQHIHIISLAIMLLAFPSCSNTQRVNITSPDGKVGITFCLDDGVPSYSVAKEGEAIIAPSSLGFALKEGGNLSHNLKVMKVTESTFDESWTQPWGEEIHVRNHYNELRIELQERSDKRRIFSLSFRAFDDGIGFRYEFPLQQQMTEMVILDELTEFALPANHKAWYIPAYTGEYYELLYQSAPIDQLDVVCTPLTMETEGGRYVAIHEANLTDYAAMNLRHTQSMVLKADLTPWSTGERVFTQAPSVTPWRTVIIADNLNELVNSRLMLNLNEPCRIDDTSWIRPSKYIGIWWGMHKEKYTWAQGPNHGATTQNVKSYIDFAADHNMRGVLVEGWNWGWDRKEDGTDWVTNGHEFNFTRPYPDYDLKELSKYASMKGVEIIGHHETGGATINYERQLEEAFAFMKKHGISAVKTGYVNNLLDKKELHSSQYGVRHYRKVVETAARYKIMIDNHEPVMPTGLQRTWPNLMTQEGVRGQEYDAWSADGGNPPEHTTILPFTRGLAGPMDFTAGTFQFDNPVYPNTRVQTTLAKQLALFVVIYSPLQMASDLPEYYLANPKAFEFIRLVPCDWSATIIPEARIGDYVVTARKDKNSEDWYLGIITDEEARSITLPLSFLDEAGEYDALIFRDGADAHWKDNPYPLEIEEKEVNSSSVLTIDLAPGGGSAIQLKKRG